MLVGSIGCSAHNAITSIGIEPLRKSAGYGDALPAGWACQCMTMNDLEQQTRVQPVQRGLECRPVRGWMQRVRIRQWLRHRQGQHLCLPDGLIDARCREGGLRHQEWIVVGPYRAMIECTIRRHGVVGMANPTRMKSFDGMNLPGIRQDVAAVGKGATRHTDHHLRQHQQKNDQVRAQRRSPPVGALAITRLCGYAGGHTYVGAHRQIFISAE